MREGGREPFNGGLAGGVRRHQGHGGECRARGDIDDRARPACAQLRDERLTHGHDPEGIGLEHLTDGGHGRGFEGSEQTDSGVVHQHIDGTAVLKGLGDAFRLGDVQGQDANVAVVREELPARRAHGGDDFPALGVEVARGFETVAGRTAGDERSFHFKLREGWVRRPR
ncbi:hypothetical protein FQZ97_853040 [compost metagenome]